MLTIQMPVSADVWSQDPLTFLISCDPSPFLADKLHFPPLLPFCFLHKLPGL